MAAPRYPHNTLPDVSRWRFSPGPNALQSDEEYAYTERRKSGRQEIRTGDAAWTFLEGENNTFQLWYDADLNKGIRRFYIKLPAEHESGFLWHVARFLQKRVVTKGFGYHEVTATLEVYPIAGEPPNDPDDFSDAVLLHLAANALTDDSSVWNRALTTSGTISLDAVRPYLGRNTYNVAPGGRLVLSDGDSFVAAMGTEEFCLEVVVKPVVNPAGENRFLSLGCLAPSYVSTGQFQCSVDGGWGSTTLATPVASAQLERFYHLAVRRHNRVAGSYSQLIISLDGDVKESLDVAKTYTIGGSGFAWALGWVSVSPHVHVAGLRLTAGSTRYGNGNFTPDPLPWRAENNRRTYVENFSSFGDYTTFRGNPAIFTVNGTTLSIASQTSANASTIRRTFTPVALPWVTFGGLFKVTASTLDDAGTFFLMRSWTPDGGGSGAVIGIVPRRDQAADATRRVDIYWNTDHIVGSASVDINVWYEFVVSLHIGVGVKYRIRREDNGTVHASGTLSGTSAYIPFVADQFAFNADAPNTTGPVQYRSCYASQVVEL